MALATIADSRRIRAVRSGADRYCTLLMTLLLLLFRPGLPGLLTVILPGARNRMVTVWQQPRIGPRLSSIWSWAYPPKGGSGSPTGRFARGRATGAEGFAQKLQATIRRGGLFRLELPSLVLYPDFWCKAGAEVYQPRRGVQKQPT